MPQPDPGVDAWTEHASAFDRVRSVASTVSQPRSAAWISERAAVAENTARDHLLRLVEMNVLLEIEDGGTTRFEPDPLHTRLQTLRDLLEQYDRDGLLALKADLQARIEDWREEFGVESPADLRALAADTDRAAETDAIREAANDWELVAYRLDVVEDAIENYGTYTDRGTASV